MSSSKVSQGRGLVVCQASAADAATLSDLYLRSWRAGYQGLVESDELEPVARQRAAHDWSAAVHDKSWFFGVGRVDGDPAGLVRIGDDPNEVVGGMWLDLLYVVPEYWGTGIASGLLEWALESSRSTGATVVRLRVVESQRRARRFYERSGWVYDRQVPPSNNEFFPLLCMRLDLV